MASIYDDYAVRVRDNYTVEILIKISGERTRVNTYE